MIKLQDKLYRHQTDGGAIYYCLSNIEGSDEGDLTSAVLRIDGNEFEVLLNNLKDNNIKLVMG